LSGTTLFGAFLQGLLLQASLILAFGAQNIFVLHSGLRRQRHLLVAFVSSLCDTFLIFVGVLGVATFFVKFPVLKTGLGMVGVGFLFYYGILKILEGKNGILFSQKPGAATTAKQAIPVWRGCFFVFGSLVFRSRSFGFIGSSSAQ